MRCQFLRFVPRVASLRRLSSWRALVAVVLSLGLLGAAGAASFSGSSQGTYLVRPGDTLWGISQRYGVSVAQLATANNMNPNDLLMIGRNLTIPSNTPAAAALASSGGSGSSGGSSGSSGSGGGAQTVNASVFCANFVASPGPWGVLPDVLRESPARLALQPIFVRWANHYNLSLPLLEAINFEESGWQQGVVSSAGAVGTGQILPQTADFISSTLVGMKLNINSVSDNIRMSAAFLAYLADIEGNSTCRTIAAYYEGPLNLSQYGAFPDTQGYVAAVEALIPRFE
jgi:murein DD-endopeptidase MepM/ murein hydrolase activator NlpD